MNWEVGMPPHRVERVVCIGAGMIGAGWATLFLSRGLEVPVWDPNPEAAEWVRALVAIAWPPLEQLGLVAGASPARWRFCETLEEAVSTAQFVQESGPDRLQLKQEILALIDAATPVSTVIDHRCPGCWSVT